MQPLCSYLFALVAFLAAITAHHQPARAEAPDPDRPLWMRAPAISPDGRTIAFTYKGQIWIVPAQGGEAAALTERQFHSTHPVWSPDGRSIAFASDRFGASSVFLAPLDGGEIRRLTHHSQPEVPLGFTPDGKNVILSAARIGVAGVVHYDALAMFPHGQVWTVPVTGGRERLLMPLPSASVSMSRDGKSLAYTFGRSIEVEWRKGQISDGTADIWIRDMASGASRQLTRHRGNDRDPVISPDGTQVYFLSEMPKTGETDPDAKPGSFNVWRRALSGATPPEQVTFHETLPVRGLSMANDGTLVYGFDGEIWRLDPKAKEPKRVPVRIRQGTLLSGPVSVKLNDQVSEVSVSPSGQELAIVARGDVWVISATTGQSRRITATPQAEASMSFSPDGRGLLYAAERAGKWEIFQTRIVRDGDTNLLDAAELAETRVLSDDQDLQMPAWSPKGDRIAFRHDRNALRVLTVASGKVVEVLPDAASYSYNEGDLGYTWSPDGRFIATITGFIADTEIELIDTESPTPVRRNVSQNGFPDQVPRFGRDGRIVYWQSDRFGPRQLDDKSAAQDVVATFLHPLDASAFAAGEPLPKEPGAIDFERIADRTVRLTGFSQPILFADLSADGARLTVVGTSATGLVGYAFDPRSGAGKSLFERPYTGTETFAASADGKTLWIASAAGLDRIDLADGKTTSIPFDTTAPHDFLGEMAYVFEHQWRFVAAKFYDPKMHGVDWKAMRERYARHLPHIAHWEDFTELMGELQGELNASHMFSRFKASSPNWEATASLGLWYDPGHVGDGARIVGVMPGGPADLPGSLLKPGALILAVDGRTIATDRDVWAYLDHAAGKKIRLTVVPPGGAPQEAVVTPVPVEKESEFAYRHWVDGRRALVARLSGGRLAYVHVAAMEAVEMQKVYAELMGRGRSAEGAIVDVRFNTGGLLHDQLVAFLGGERHSGLVSRNGVDYGTSPYTRWAKPTAAVANASSYSDGSIFPFFYMREKIGPMVGDRVPGTGTAVLNIPQIEPRLKLGVAQIGFRTKEGRYLENLEIVPTEVLNTEPNFIERGQDPQLERAVALLLATLPKK